MLGLGAAVVPRPTAALKRIAAVLSFGLVAAAAARRRSRCWMSAACTGLVSLSSGAEPGSAMLDGAHPVGTGCRGGKTRACEAPAEVSRALRCLVNSIRRERALPVLRSRRRLDMAASRHVREMVARGYFSHTSPGGATIGDRLRRCGSPRPGRAWRAGEALAWGIATRSTPAAVVRAWLHSPPHRALLLDRRFRDAGVGVAAGVAVDVDRRAPGAAFGRVLGAIGR